MQKGSLLMHQRDESALAIRNISGEQHIGGSCLASNTVDEIVEVSKFVPAEVLGS